MTTIFIILILALVVLVASGHWIVKLMHNITTAFGLSEFTAAFLLLALATSVPEIFMGIASAHHGAGEIILALSLGSIVINITLIISLAALISAGIKITDKRLKKNISFSILLSIAPLFFLIDGTITRFEGSMLIIAFLIYLVILYRNKPKVTIVKKIPRHILKGVTSFFSLLILLAVLLIASDQTVSSAVLLAESINLSPFLIGIFLLAIGTSLPELTTTLNSAWQRKPNMTLGNILGSNAADSTLVIGIASLVAPVQISIDPYIVITIIFVLLANLALGYFALSRQRISITESVILLLIFILFIASLIMTGAPVIMDSPY